MLCQAEVVEGYGAGAVTLAHAHVYLTPAVYGVLTSPRQATPKLAKPKAITAEIRKRRASIKKHLRNLDENVASRIRKSLKIAMNGADPRKLLRKFDKNRDGSWSADEFRRLIRMELRIAPNLVSDESINSLVQALDDDGSGCLNIEEVADFVERGAETFFDHEEEQSPDDGGVPSGFFPSLHEASAPSVAALAGWELPTPQTSRPGTSGQQFLPGQAVGWLEEVQQVEPPASVPPYRPWRRGPQLQTLGWQAAARQLAPSCGFFRRGNEGEPLRIGTAPAALSAQGSSSRSAFMPAIGAGNWQGLPSSAPPTARRQDSSRLVKGGLVFQNSRSHGANSWMC